MMELTFTQAAKGVNKEMSVNIDAACQRCDGKGHEPGTKVQHCHYCNGSGMVSSIACSFPPQVYSCFINTIRALVPVGDREHGPICNALHMSLLWR